MSQWKQEETRAEGRAGRKGGRPGRRWETLQYPSRGVSQAQGGMYKAGAKLAASHPDLCASRFDCVSYCAGPPMSRVFIA